MTTTTKLLGKKDIEHFLYLSVTITTIYRDIAEQSPNHQRWSTHHEKQCQLVKHSGRFSFNLLHPVVIIPILSEASFQVPFTLKKYEWFHQYRCPNSKFQSNWQKIECKINILQNLQKYCEIGTVQIEDYDRRRKCRESRGRGDQGENSGWCNKCSVRRKLNTGHLFSSSKRLVLAMS